MMPAYAFSCGAFSECARRRSQKVGGWWHGEDVEEQQPWQHRGGSTTSSTWTSFGIIKSVHCTPLNNKTINRDNSNNINKKNHRNNLLFF
jgi:hypothetical protein